MSYHVVFTKRAKKQLEDIPSKQRQLVLAWIQRNLVGCENPRSIEGSKQIKGTSEGWRYRVGSYRILAKIVDDELVIEVVRVGHRQGVYSNLPDL